MIEDEKDEKADFFQTNTGELSFERVYILVKSSFQGSASNKHIPCARLTTVHTVARLGEGDSRPGGGSPLMLELFYNSQWTSGPATLFLCWGSQ